MSGLKFMLLAALAAWFAVVAVLYLTQRSLMYFPERIRTSPVEAGLPAAQEILLDTDDGEKIVVWRIAPDGDRPVFLYFHGNGGALRNRADRFRQLTASGAGLLALSYRGYGGSSGSPSESGLIADAKAVYANAVARYPANRIVLWGESLGTAVAVALAAERAVGRVVLESPFVSAVALAQQAYPFAPVGLLMKDQFRSDLRIVKVTAPVLVLHGDRDGIVPIESGERLYALIKSPKRFVRIAGGGHDNLGGFGAVETALQFVDQTFE